MQPKALRLPGKGKVKGMECSSGIRMQATRSQTASVLLGVFLFGGGCFFLLFLHPCRSLVPVFAMAPMGLTAWAFGVSDWKMGLEFGGHWKRGNRGKKGKTVMGTPRASNGVHFFFSHWHNCGGRDSGIWRRRPREKKDTGTGQGMEYQGVFCVRGAGWAGVVRGWNCAIGGNWTGLARIGLGPWGWTGNKQGGVGVGNGGL